MNQMNVYCDKEDRIIIAESDWKVCPYCGKTLTGQHGINRFGIKYDPTLPGKYEQCTGLSPIRFQVKPWGYLEAIEFRFVTPVPNMDVARPHTFDFVRYTTLSDNPFHVFAKVRNA